MRRIRIPEVMDDPALDADEHTRALRALNRANRLLGVDRGLYHAVQRVAGNGECSILDLGAGGAGFLAYVAGRAQDSRGGLRLALDRSGFALAQAARWHDGALCYVAADALSLPLADDSVDVVTSSLFLHHFDPPEIVDLLREAARVCHKGIVMGDLTRSRIALALTWAAAHAFTRSRVFRVDGPRSVRAALRPTELTELASRAGLPDARMTRQFPFRMIMTWRKVPQSKTECITTKDTTSTMDQFSKFPSCPSCPSCASW